MIQRFAEAVAEKYDAMFLIPNWKSFWKWCDSGEYLAPKPTAVGACGGNTLNPMHPLKKKKQC